MKKIVRALLLAALTISSALTVGYAAEINEWDSPMWRMREEFYGGSSWDFGNASSSIKNDIVTRDNMSNYGLTDGSTLDYHEGYRAINDIEHGKYVWDFDFTMDREMNGVVFRLLNDTTPAISIITKNNALYLEQQDGSTIYLGAYTSSIMADSNRYFVKVEFDMDQKKVTRIFINGKIVCENADFTNPESKINAYTNATDIETVGNLRNGRVYLYGGYHIREDFFNTRNPKPDDWNMDTEKGQATVYTANNRNMDKYSVKLDTAADSIRYYKKIDPVSGNQIFEIYALQPVKRDGLSFAVKSNGQEVFSVTTDGNQFIYNGNGTSVPFYEYMTNVWYGLRYDIDLENHTADVYLNHKLKAENIPINPNLTTIDEVEIFAAQNENGVIIDDILLHNKRVLPDDYVERPVKPQKKNEDILVGMQMCPLWTEGYYTNSWDTMKRCPDRTPILGLYDEGEPEVSDWQTKYMVENGVDFQYICAYPNIPMTYNTSKTYNGYDSKPSPIKPTMVREGHSIVNGHMLSEYSDMIDFAIVIEVATVTGSCGFMADVFIENWLPYYIEYYFKDERYATIDGRPIVGVFSPNNFKNMFDDGTGKESVREGIKRIGDACEAAGVGRPYFIVQSGFREADLANVYDCGFDAIGQYNSYGTMTQQIDNQMTRIEAVKKYKMDNVVDLAMGFDNSGWNLDGSIDHATLTPNQYGQMLQYYYDNLIPNLERPSGVSKQIVSGETWDEYGEGHIIAPTRGNGFAYLNKIRDVFCVEGDYENVYPTEAQLERIGRLTVQDGRKTRNYYIKSKTEIPSTVKTEWNFSNDADAQSWIVNQQVASLTTEGGKLVVTPSGSHPTIMIGGIDIDIHDVKYVKVRMNKPSTSSGGHLLFGTSAKAYSLRSRLDLVNDEEPTNDMVDYYVPVEINPYWKGNLNSLYLDLGYTSDYSEPFIIESVQLLSDPELNKSLLKTEKYTYVIPEVTVKNGTVMIPAYEVVTEVGGTVQWYGGTNSYAIRSKGKNYYATVGSTTATKNGVEATLPEAPYAASDIVNDTAYIPMDFVAEALDMIMEYDEKEHILYVTQKEKAEEVKSAVLPNRDDIIRYDFNDGTAVSRTGNLSGVKYEDGKMKATSTTNDSQIFLTFEGVDASAVKALRISENLSSASGFTLYFLTDKDTKWNEAKSLKGKVPAGGYVTEVLTADQPNWKDKITAIRFDPTDNSGSTIEIDFISLMGEEIAAKKSERVYDMTSCTSIKNGQYIWSFDKNSDLDGWGGNKSIVNLGVFDGVLTAKVAGSKPTLTTRGDIPYNAEDVSGIEIKMANTTSGRKAKLYYTTDTSTTWSEANSVTIDLMPNNTVSQTYTVDFSGQQGWSGKIRQLMLVPTDGKGDISIDSIALKINE